MTDVSPDAIDQDVLDELEHSVGDDRGFLREVVETWIEDAPRLIAQIRSGIGAGDVERVNRAAHTLKSNSASIGALGLSAMSRELETMTSIASTEPSDLAEPEISALADVIALEFEHARGELEALIPPGSNNS